MKTIEESLATSMDKNQNVAIVPFLPNIFQDFWEMGTSSEIVINLVQKYFQDYSNLNVLDLGCGKGAVLVKLAEKLKCKCIGIDGISKFIETSKVKAKEYGVDKFCQFEIGDIRKRIETLDKFDVIILGAIGQIFGNYYTTLTKLSGHLLTNGIIIIYDSYTDDSNNFQHLGTMCRRELLTQVEQAGMELSDEITNDSTGGKEGFENIKKRCKELIFQYPEKRILFETYIQSQTNDCDVLDNKVTCSTIVCKRKVDKIPNT